jgi:hypothetical protein
MNITISHDGSAVILRIEPGDDGAPITIGGMVPGSVVGSSTPTTLVDAAPRRSRLQSRPIRLLALGAVLLVFIQVGMVISGSSRTAIQPRNDTTPISMFTPHAKTKRTATHAIEPPHLDATGSPPAIKPGSAQAQRQFGLDP